MHEGAMWQRFKIDYTFDGLGLLREHLGHRGLNTTASYWKVAGEEHRHRMKDCGEIGLLNRAYG
jgi:hypothetical protein